MVKRLFFSLVGLGAGAVLGGYAVRKVERGRQRLTPQRLGRGQRPGVLERISAAVQAGRAAAALREAELRATYGNGQAPPEFDGVARPR
ncbi:MAG: hypothetical protein ACRD0K_08030 [Egibacteraceae bacterium]